MAAVAHEVLHWITVTQLTNSQMLSMLHLLQDHPRQDHPCVHQLHLLIMTTMAIGIVLRSLC